MEEAREQEKEVVREVVYVKPKKSPIRRALVIIFDTLLVLLALYFIVGYYNVKRIYDEQEPIIIQQGKTYVADNDHNVTVWNGYVYKIVRDEGPKDITLQLKLWFMKDIK